MQPQGPQLPSPLGQPSGSPQQPQYNPYPTDYLNQIAPPLAKQGVSNRLLFIIIGVAVLVIGLFAMLMLGNAGRSDDLRALGVKVPKLQSVTKDAEKNLKNSTLRSINSSLNLYFTNTQRDMKPILESNGIKVDDKIEDESVTKMTETLENARLTDIYDETYADEMKHQLSRLDIHMTAAYNNTNSSSTKKFLETANKDLKTFYDQLTKFSSPTE